MDNNPIVPPEEQEVPEEQEAAEVKEKRVSPPPRFLFDMIETFVIAVCVVFLIFMSGVRFCRVDGDSMNNTLYHGENLIISNWFYEPKAGDIVVFHQTSEDFLWLNEPIVKRVIATEGQFVKIDTEAALVYVSEDDLFTEDEALSEPYAYLMGGVMHDSAGISGTVFEVPKGCVFVLGDNRNNSTDSRSASIGFVDTRRILGKVVLRLSPR